MRPVCLRAISLIVNVRLDSYLLSAMYLRAWGEIQDIILSARTE